MLRENRNIPKTRTGTDCSPLATGPRPSNRWAGCPVSLEEAVERSGTLISAVQPFDGLPTTTPPDRRESVAFVRAHAEPLEFVNTTTSCELISAYYLWRHTRPDGSGPVLLRSRRKQVFACSRGDIELRKNRHPGRSGRRHENSPPDMSGCSSDTLPGIARQPYQRQTVRSDKPAPGSFQRLVVIGWSGSANGTVQARKMLLYQRLYRFYQAVPIVSLNINTSRCTRVPQLMNSIPEEEENLVSGLQNMCEISKSYCDFSD
ncbi:uncharacterized protein LOC128266860 [Anopheles cruzii]|uniref:uncharacterized protein LOC128266860 n=1 Tax=Anopheles cruzii TaxID=68878 RepID=UPI0022EC8DAA|nr:uncharacterized protein LOC128266860 [Anopheles cruzii]